MIHGVAGDLPPGLPAASRSRRTADALRRGADRLRRRTSGTTRALLVALVAGLALALVAALGGGAATAAVAAALVLVATAALLGVAARVQRTAAPRRPGLVVAWALLALACLALVAGLTAVHAGAAGTALLLVLRERLRSRRPAQLGNAVVVLLGSLAVGTALVAAADAAAGAVLARAPADLPEHLLSGPAAVLGTDGDAALAAVGETLRLPAPLTVVVLLALTLACAALGGPRAGPSLRWLAGGFALLGAGATLAARAQATGGGQPPGAQAWGPALLVALAGVAAVAVATLPPPRHEPAAGPGRRSSDRPGAGPAALPQRPLSRTLPAVLTVAALALLAVRLGGAQVPAASAVLALAALGAGATRTLLLGRSAAPDGAADGARTDPLTGLASRKAISEALAGEVVAPRRAEGGTDAASSAWTDRIALLLVDIDRFEDINVALGREAGDEVLTEVGARLQAVLRPDQLLARLGGDEFAVLLPGAAREPATRVAQALRDALGEPLRVGGTRLHVRATVGVATCLLPRGDPQDLLRQADQAVSRAKAAGTGVEVYDPGADRHGPQRMRRIDELRSALERGDLEVYLQPQVELATGRIVGAEALARWRHPHDGVLLPEAFLPLAGQTGLLRPVAAAVLGKALTACARWWRLGHAVPVSVNLSADDLRDTGLTERITTELARHGLPASALRIELTEDVLVTDPAAVATLLRSWRAAGVAVALDDYGTGYSSLAYLRELPVDELKIDQVFVADLGRRATATIVLHTIAMAHGLGLRVVAEGIEDEATAQVLTGAGCDVGQGLFFGAAMTPDAFLAHLARPA